MRSFRFAFRGFRISEDPPSHLPFYATADRKGNLSLLPRTSFRIPGHVRGWIYAEFLSEEMTATLTQGMLTAYSVVA